VSETTNAGGSPTVVLVHGAFADASSWTGLGKRLQAKGVQATAPANPLRGISIDSADREEVALDGGGCHSEKSAAYVRQLPRTRATV
jgi:pimeloyl-ACP methyl ester carboxylesterase